MAQTINPCWWVLAQLAVSPCRGLVVGLKLLFLLFQLCARWEASGPRVMLCVLED